MAVAALIISIVSATAAIAVVVVTYRAHKEQGSLLRCEFKTAYVLPPEEVERLRGDTSEWGEQHAAVFAINAGRSAVTIAEWGFAFLDKRKKPTKATIVSTKYDDEAPLPYRLEGESQQSWKMPSAGLNAEVERHEQTEPFYGVVAFIRSGADRMVYAPEPVKFG